MHNGHTTHTSAGMRRYDLRIYIVALTPKERHTHAAGTHASYLNTVTSRQTQRSDWWGGAQTVVSCPPLMRCDVTRW